MKDYFYHEVDVGDIVIFKSEHSLSEGIVIEIVDKERVKINETVTGYKFKKHPRDIINKTLVDSALKIVYPENYI